jgi:hypothetical protein
MNDIVRFSHSVKKIWENPKLLWFLVEKKNVYKERWNHLVELLFALGTFSINPQKENL